MIFPYIGCFTLRSTRTTTVLSVLSETTVPTRIRLGIVFSLRAGRRFWGSLSTLSLQRLDPGDVATHFLDAGRTLELVGGCLEAEVEGLALQFGQVTRQLIVALDAHVADFVRILGGHHAAPRCEVSPSRATTLTLIGSFIAARLKATAAMGPGTPSSSNRIRPGFTRAAQYSTEPLPLP